MSEALDEKIGRLLREDAPAERDTLFRIGLIERRERARYQLRQKSLVAAAAALAVIFAIIIATGGPGMPRMEVLRAGLIVAFSGALAAALFFCIRGVRQVLRSLRGH